MSDLVNLAIAERYDINPVQYNAISVIYDVGAYLDI